MMALINQIERFGGSWENLEKSNRLGLSQLKSIATVSSVGASTRIEGSKMSDAEVDVLLASFQIQKLTERDAQEVAGYYEVLELITGSFAGIDLSENSIKDLHNRLLKYSTKDEWHKGNYKQHTNHVEATMPDGSKQLVFQTTAPGYATQDAMRSLFQWYTTDDLVHPLVKIAIFTYEFLSIHPFQDGNGRLSRLITTLLLLKEGYNWIPYISFEHEIEKRKTNYYSTLRLCQAQRPHEDVTPWAMFFLDCLVHLQQLLSEKLKTAEHITSLSPRERSILLLIRERPGIQSGEIATRLGIPLPTVKRIMAVLVERQTVGRIGVGRGTGYVLK
ncbi:MAG: Fic family protein [Saprospiraceae bacterium]